MGYRSAKWVNKKESMSGRAKRVKGRGPIGGGGKRVWGGESGVVKVYGMGRRVKGKNGV